MKSSSKLLLISSLLVGTVVFGGCATNKDVNERVAQSQARTDQKIESIEGQIENIQEQQRANTQKISQVSREASEALRRAEEAGRLARGRVVFEESFTEDKVRFRLDSAALTDEAKATLSGVAKRIKDLNRPVWIEIQGHTDATGPESYNEALGEERAESVRRYLNREHKLPLARMSTISYGESLPKADNKTRDGRAQNRRVVIIALE